jgi:hypothetical protein
VHSVTRDATRRTSTRASTSGSAGSSGSAPSRSFDAFTFAFEETEHGWFNLHAYRFDDDWSTFIVETPEETWKKAGLDAMERERVGRVLRGACSPSCSTASG